MSVLLTGNLPLIADAPDGIRKLRGLILELAVRGKLVPQDPKDEPASELLKRIAVERLGLEAARRIRKSKPLQEIGNAAQPFPLPPNWAWARLGEVTLESGAGWSPNCESRRRENDEWGVLKVSAVSWGTFDPDENKALPSNLQPRPDCEVVQGDFLVSRANTAELVARSVWVESCPQRLMLSDKIVRLKLSQHVIGRFVNLANSCTHARNYYAAVAGGTSSSMKNVSREQILNSATPLPPLAEQHRIVAKVDELMALCDRLEAEQADAEAAHARLVDALLAALTRSTDAADFAANWQRLAAHFDTLFTTEAAIDALKQTVLQLAVMGKLVPQDPDDEPASEFLTLISQERVQLEAKGTAKKWKPRLPVEGDEQPFELPNGWEWARLGDLGLLGSSSRVHQKDWTDRGVPFYRAREIVKLSQNGFVRNELYISEALFESLSASGLVPAENDLMVTGVGTIGVPYIVNKADKFYFKDASVLIFKNYHRLCAKYIFTFMTSPFWVNKIHEKSMGTTVDTLTIARANEVPFPLPPLAEQHRIVAKVDELMALCDRLKADLAAARQRQATLADTLIAAALEAA